MFTKLSVVISGAILFLGQPTKKEPMKILSNLIILVRPIRGKLSCLAIDSQNGLFATQYCNQTNNFVCFYKPTDQGLNLFTIILGVQLNHVGFSK